MYIISTSTLFFTIDHFQQSLMARRLKLKLSRVIPSFQSCRSKSPLPESPAPATISGPKFCLSPVNPRLIDIDFPVVSPERKHPLSLKQQTIFAIGCGCRNSSRSHFREQYSDDFEYPASDFCWKKEEKWHVIAKIPDEDVRRKISDPGEICPPVSPASSPTKSCFQIQDPRLKNPTKHKTPKKKKLPKSSRVSTSSGGDSGWFSSEEEQETETLVSSRSFSSDSSEFYTNLQTIHESSRPRRLVQRKCKAKRYGSGRLRNTSEHSEPESPARRSVFRRLIPGNVNGKVRESFAVVKSSEDPYGDFRNSMLEMILEKQMFETRDLEQLLQCFLSLNSQHHHAMIVRVFSEIWEVLFCRSDIVSS